VAALTLSACSSSSTHSTPRRTSPSSPIATESVPRASSPTSPPTAAATTVAPSIAPSIAPHALDRAAAQVLRAHLVDSIPGYALQPAGQTSSGPWDLATAANDQGGAAEQAALRDAGFRAGYKLLFSSGDREILEVAYRFATPAGAGRYSQRAFAARVHDGGA